MIFYGGRVIGRIITSIFRFYKAAGVRKRILDRLLGASFRSFLIFLLDRKRFVGFNAAGLRTASVGSQFSAKYRIRWARLLGETASDTHHASRNARWSLRRARRERVLPAKRTLSEGSLGDYTALVSAAGQEWISLVHEGTTYGNRVSSHESCQRRE